MAGESHGSTETVIYKNLALSYELPARGEMIGPDSDALNFPTREPFPIASGVLDRAMGKIRHEIPEAKLSMVAWKVSRPCFIKDIEVEQLYPLLVQEKMSFSPWRWADKQIVISKTGRRWIKVTFFADSSRTGIMARAFYLPVTEDVLLIVNCYVIQRGTSIPPDHVGLNTLRELVESVKLVGR